jgi:hypothetical protein
MEHVMQRVESFDGLTYSNMGSHIFWSLDDGQMGLQLRDMVMMAHIWAESPYFGQCTHTLLDPLMEDVALGLGWTPCRDDMYPLSTLNTGIFDDDVMC